VVPLPGAPAMPSLPEPVPELVTKAPLVIGGSVISVPPWPSLRALFGNETAQATKAEEIESKLRMAFGLHDFRATKLFQAIINWERANVPFVVLRNEVRGGAI
jgi:hypothetical protein